MCLKNRMYFDIAAVPAVVQACVTLYNFILTEDGVAKDEIFHDDMPTRRARASRRPVRATQAADGVGPSGAGGGRICQQGSARPTTSQPTSWYRHAERKVPLRTARAYRPRQSTAPTVLEFTSQRGRELPSCSLTLDAALPSPAPEQYLDDSLSSTGDHVSRCT